MQSSENTITSTDSNPCVQSPVDENVSMSTAEIYEIPPSPVQINLSNNMSVSPDDPPVILPAFHVYKELVCHDHPTVERRSSLTPLVEKKDLTMGEKFMQLVNHEIPQSIQFYSTLDLIDNLRPVELQYSSREKSQLYNSKSVILLDNNNVAPVTIKDSIMCSDFSTSSFLSSCSESGLFGVKYEAVGVPEVYNSSDILEQAIFQSDPCCSAVISPFSRSFPLCTDNGTVQPTFERRNLSFIFEAHNVSCCIQLLLSYSTNILSIQGRYMLNEISFPKDNSNLTAVSSDELLFLLEQTVSQVKPQCSPITFSNNSEQNFSQFQCSVQVSKQILGTISGTMRYELSCEQSIFSSHNGSNQLWIRCLLSGSIGLKGDYSAAPNEQSCHTFTEL